MFYGLSSLCIFYDCDTGVRKAHHNITFVGWVLYFEYFVTCDLCLQQIRAARQQLNQDMRIRDEMGLPLRLSQQREKERRAEREKQKSEEEAKGDDKEKKEGDDKDVRKSQAVLLSILISIILLLA